MLKPFDADAASGVPLYLQVKQYVIECINEGYWKPNQQIPTQIELCKHLGVSRITIVRALQDLVASGVLEARQGVGTFVQGDRWVQQLVSAAELYRRTYGNGQSATYRVLDRQKLLAQDAGAEGESFSELTPIWRVRRLRLLGKRASSIGELLIPAHLVQTEQHLHDLETMVLYDFLTSRCGVRVDRTRVHIGAIRLSEQSAQLLNSEPGEAALVIRRFILNSEGTVVAVSHNIHDTNASNYYFEFVEQDERIAEAGLQL